MAKLYLKNAREFENPSRRIFKEGGGELFGSAGGQAAKINTWVGGKESSPEARALAENVSKQAEEIREGTRKELLELYVNIFTDTIPQKEVYNVAPLTVDATYAKNGLLQVLEKNSPDLRVVFQGTPDLRLLSYATVYQNFKVQGLDVNFLPIGAKVALVNGDVTVTYIEKGITKTATSEIFPWSTYELAHQKYLRVLEKDRAEKARQIEEAGGPQSDALEEVLNEPTTGLPPEEPTVDTLKDEAERDEALKEEWLTKVKPRLQSLETIFPGIKVTITDASFDKKANKPADEVDKYPNYGKHGKTIEIHYGPKKTDVKRYQIIVHKDADSYFDSSVIVNRDVEKGLGVTWAPIAHSKTEDVLDILAGEADLAVKKDVEDAIAVADLARLNELTPAQQLYYLDWYVSRTLAMAQKDPRTLTKAEQKEVDEFYEKNVVMEVSEKWYLELSKRPDLDPTSHVRLGLTEEKIRALQELRKAHPYEGMHKKEVAEYDMSSLFTDFDGSPETWRKVDAQYKKMRQEFAEGRISALDHYRGSEAAAHAGRIDEAIALLDLAAKNAGDRTYEKADAVGNQEALRSKYGTISLNERTNHYFTYTPAPGAEGQLYTAAALEYAKTEFQKNGRFEGRVPLGTYEVGGTKIYTVTAEGTTVRDKNAPAAVTAPASIEPAPIETSAAVPATDQETLKKTAQAAADALELSMLLTPRNISDGIKTYERKVGAETEWVLSQFQDGDFSYLIMTDRHLAPPNGDGSAEWTVDFKAADGDVFRVAAQAEPVDMAKVRAYREAQAARGLDYSEADLVKYLSYRTVTGEFARNMRETRDNVGLNKKYMAYLAANRPEVAAVTVPPTEAPVLNLDDEELPDLGVRFTPDITPGLPEGDYKEFDTSLFSTEDPYTGLVSLEWPDGTFFQGAMMDSVPNGMGVLGLGGAQETLGPVQFVDGKATVELPESKKKEITWDTQLSRFDVKDL